MVAVAVALVLCCGMTCATVVFLSRNREVAGEALAQAHQIDGLKAAGLTSVQAISALTRRVDALEAHVARTEVFK